MEVAAWLRSLGLERYEAVFRDNDIDVEVLPELTPDDLIGLGVSSIGDRRKLLSAIAELSTAAPISGGSVAPACRAAPVPTEAERRQLTVLFCDLVGSTALAGRLDPEDLREVVASYHSAVVSVVRGFDGFVAKYMGDGVLVYFGYPSAHEDDAERAIRAGLGVVDAVGRLDVKSVHLRARVGIATGLVVVGEGSAQEQSIVGETPSLAAQLQAVSQPETVVIAAGTRRLVGDLFEYLDLGMVEIRDMATPVPVWQVLRTSVVASRFEALRGSVLSRLVGRDEEMELLLRRWAHAKAADGQVVLISGEPGLGKSRIVAALAERLQMDAHTRLRYFCSPYYQDSALFPFIDQLGRASGFAREDPPARRLEKLEAWLAHAAQPDNDIALISDLLSLPVSERHPLPNLSPQRKKERILEALIRQLQALARRRPVLMVFEDAHWIDPTSRELLDLAIERLSTLRVLLIVTFRPEFRPPWTGQPQVTTLALNRLDRHDRTVLVGQVARGKALPDVVVEQIADRTDGVPLFVEELTKSLLESGLLREETDRWVIDRPLPPLAIPTSLHASFLARLDRLASARRIAQIGAAIGREFSYALLRVVCRLPEDELQAALARLVASELIFQRGAPPEAVYAFKHALVQDAAHASLLRSTRQQLHARIVEALETHSPELMDSQPALFAQHYAEAGLIEKSVACWGKAGHRSIARSAMAEAATQLQKGLDQLNLLPDTPERQRQELEFRSSLGVVLRFLRGLASSETGRAFARARVLWEQLGSPSEFLHVPYWQSLYHQNRAELDLAQSLDDSLLGLSRQRNDSAGLVLGHLSSARTSMYAGGFASSRAHLEAVLALYDPVSQQSRVQHAVIHPQIASQAYLGNVLFCLGFPDQALAQSNAAIAEAHRLAHPPSLAGILITGTRLLALVGDDAALDERAGELVAVASEHGFSHWGAQATIYRGWVKVKNGDVAEGMSLLRHGLSAYRTAGAETFVPHYLALLARSSKIAGQSEDAVNLFDEALRITERTGARWFAAELTRHKGRLLARQGHAEAAEELYRKAMSIAVEQEAKLWELQASVSLARLWRDQGRNAEARDLLAPIYSWFTEGFDTPALVNAKALLDELGGA
jgi:class 3 adenylate cyclase/predicted ATPase